MGFRFRTNGWHGVFAREELLGSVRRCAPGSAIYGEVLHGEPAKYCLNDGPRVAGLKQGLRIS